MRRICLTVIAIIFHSLTLMATAELMPGDIYLVGFGGNSDDFAFMPLVDLSATEVICFTDRGWSNDTFWSESSEGALSYQPPAGGLPAGTTVIVTNSPGGGFGATIFTPLDDVTRNPRSGQACTLQLFAPPFPIRRHESYATPRAVVCPIFCIDSLPGCVRPALDVRKLPPHGYCACHEPDNQGC